jgi:hypothetical protein
MSENTNNSRTELHKRHLILMRRNKVMELASQGYNQSQICKSLGVSQSLVSLDLQALKCQAADNVRTWINETLPMEINKALTGISLVVRVLKYLILQILTLKRNLPRLNLYC